VITLRSNFCSWVFTNKNGKYFESGIELVGSFLDDIFISSMDKPEINNRIHTVLKKLDSARLKMCKDKCEH